MGRILTKESSEDFGTEILLSYLSHRFLHFCLLLLHILEKVFMNTVVMGTIALVHQCVQFQIEFTPLVVSP